MSSLALPTTNRRTSAAAIALACGITAVGLVATDAPAQTASSELDSKMRELQQNVGRQGSLRSEIDRQNAQVNELIARESELRRGAAGVQAELDRRQAELDQATAALNSERQHLRQVRARLTKAYAVLESLLVDIYKSSTPDTLSVVLNAASWQDLLSQSEYLERLRDYENDVVAGVKTLRGQVEAAVQQLAATQQGIKVGRDAVLARRQELAAVQSDVAAQHSQLVAARSERQATLAALQAGRRIWRISSARPSRARASVPPSSARLRSPPAGAPLAVKAVIEAANRISDKPYIWGGGHGSFEDSGYDCSGAVSYALHGGGLLDSPMDSTGFTVYADPGAGNWITTYAESGHMYAVVAGLRFDAGGPGGGNGPRWSTVMRSPSGFVARHPSGL